MVIIVTILWGIWEIVTHASTVGWVIDKWHGFHVQTAASASSSPSTGWAWISSPGIIPALVFICGVLWLTAQLSRPSESTSEGPLLKRTRAMATKLGKFVSDNEGNVTAIHFLYDAKFRIPVDKLFSELAAVEVCDILEGDWVINPQLQTAKNIRENVIAQLMKCADRLQAKQSAPRSKLVGELEAGKFTVFGDSISGGVRIYSTNLCIKLRVTNKEPREVTVKRAGLKLTLDGEAYRGIKTSLWYPNSGKDFMERITDQTPIRHAIATTGLLEFTVEGLKRPDRGVAADVSITLIDEFEIQHTIRNKRLWIAV